MSHTIAQSLLPEFDVEMANTRKVLERVPDARLEYKPHAKSMSLGRLAGHLAEVPVWALMTLGQDELDLRPNGVYAFESYTAASCAEALQRFDEAVAKVRPLLEGTSDAAMMQPWTLKDNGQTMMTLPRAAVLRSFVMNHMIHHRAQLGVYLRLNDVPVPQVYGPTADEL